MTLGNKLIELRKQNKMTQEQAGEKLNVTRQTISNWELDQTKPDLDQIKGLSKLYNISIDELIDNDVKEILTEKVSTVEKLTGRSNKTLKWLIIFIGILIAVFIIWVVLSVTTYAWFIGSNKMYECYLNNEKYYIEVETEQEEYIEMVEGKKVCCREGKVIDVMVSPYISIPELEKQEREYQVKNLVFNYFEKNGGSCNLYENKIE